MTKLVKICGIKTVEAADKAIDSGADLLGMILVPKRKRTIDHEVAAQISLKVKQTRQSRHRKYQTIEEIQKQIAQIEVKDSKEYFQIISQLLIDNGPFLVGVFRNQSIEDVLEIAHKLQLDFIQLHGSENKIEYSKSIPHQFGVIPRYVIPEQTELMPIEFQKFIELKTVGLPLLDSDAGGEGKVIDWVFINEHLGFSNFILAGGLNPTNLKDTTSIKNIIGYDVSGGVEDENGDKDFQEIENFIKVGKTV
ncbi:phosphoribosylanthranilate isomerase [Scheffersomyces coipomensis]|uniref:phosphoribosylanthranilate isomerase n=1 Tax=Scheffersomyces coipomensis TaxID=1788519 RepID=UPI00315CE94D